MLRPRKIVEIRVPSTGKILLFRCQTSDRNEAIRRVVPFIEAVEDRYQEGVFWKFKDENVYFFSRNFYLPEENSLGRKILGFLGLA